MKRLVIFVVGQPEHDPRVAKSARWGVLNGYDVHVVAGFYDPEHADDPVLMRCGSTWGDHHWPSTSWRVRSDMATLVAPALCALEPDVLHVHELTALLAVCVDWEADDAPRVLARLAAGQLWPEAGVRFRRPPVPRLVYDVHEYERERDRLEHIGPAMGWVEDRCVPLCDAVIATGPAQIAALLEHVHHPCTGWTPNGPVVSVGTMAGLEARTAVREVLGIDSGQLLVGWAGTITPIRCLDLIIEGTRRAGGQLLLVGDGTAEFMAPIVSQPGVIAVGRRPMPWTEAEIPWSMLWYLAACDVGVSILDPRVKNQRLASANKVWEYAAAGLPIVVNNQPDAGETGALVYDALPGAESLSRLPTAAELASAIHSAHFRLSTEWRLQLRDLRRWDDLATPVLRRAYGETA